MSRKVLLVGWDAADWRVLRPLLRAGQMPHLSGLIARGTSGPLHAPHPLFSPTLWASIVTGRLATDHGVLSALELSPDRSRLHPIGRSVCHAEPIWETLSRAGVPCHAINFPVTHPAQPIGGVSVSNRFPAARSVWPSEHYDVLDSFCLTATDIDAASLLTFVPRAAEVDRRTDGRLDAIAEALALSATTHNAITWAMEHVPWEFAAVCYMGIHQLSHVFMPFHSPRRDHVDARDFELYQYVVTAAYRFHDLMLGRLLQLASSDAHVILVSDHGFHSDHLRPTAAATTDEELLAWHRPRGVVASTDLGISSVLDVAPTILRLFGINGPEKVGRVLVDAEPSREADVSHLLELGYVEGPDLYADAAAERLADRRQFHLAEAWLEQGQPEEAVGILESLVRKHSVAIEYRVVLAHAYAAVRRLDDCRRLVEALRREFPESAEALAGIGMLELEARRASSAVEHLRRAEAMGLRSAGMYADLGQAYLRLRLFEDAGRSFRQATQFDEELVRAWVGLSAAELGRGETDSAIDSARRTIALSPSDPEAHYRLGRAMSAAGRDADARTALEAAVAINPDFAVALRKLSELAERAGDLKSAREYDRRAHLATVRKRWGGRLTVGDTARRVRG